MSAINDIMAVRRSALDSMAKDGPPPGIPFARIRLALGDYLHGSRPRPHAGHDIPLRLASAISDRLCRRHQDAASPGAAVLSGITDYFTLPEARTFHETLFHAVWATFRDSNVRPGASSSFRIKDGVIADGAIPRELYGSSWSFKQLHIDREALIFSHLYGPVIGFTGGDIMLVDIKRYMSEHSLSFVDIFDWSFESTEGSKPVLKPSHHDRAVTRFGVNLGPLGPDEIMFVNNLPDAGILHGVAPVEVIDAQRFRREYHRCSVKDLRPW